jgi:hypothetical protein
MYIWHLWGPTLMVALLQYRLQYKRRIVDRRGVSATMSAAESDSTAPSKRAHIWRDGQNTAASTFDAPGLVCSPSEQDAGLTRLHGVVSIAYCCLAVGRGSGVSTHLYPPKAPSIRIQWSLRDHR